MHLSHQNRMDVDVWFHLTGSARSANDRYPEGRNPGSMIAPEGLDLSREWGEQQRFLFKTSADHPRGDRIFVNPAIKRALC